MFFRTVSYHHTYRGVEGPVLDGILFTEISVNEVNMPAAENGRGGRCNVHSGLRRIHAGSGRGDFGTSSGFMPTIW